MIAFDNGPADGDYVRYIEAMAKAAASDAAQAGAGSMTASAAPGFGETMMQARARQAATRRSTMTPAATAAMAQAAVLQNVGIRSVAWPTLGRALGLVLAGALLTIIGFAMTPGRPIVIALGVAVLFIGFRLAARTTAGWRGRTGPTA